MSVYDAEGELNFGCYSKDGSRTGEVYDVNGEPHFFTSIKVATYNVGQWYLGNHDNVPSALDEVYYDLQNGMLTSIDADIIIFQEYTKQFSKAGRTALSMLQSHYQYIHEQGGDTATATNGRCICSKYPITQYTTGSYTTGSSNYYDCAEIDVNGVTIYVFNTHLHWSQDAHDTTREAQAKELASIASQHQNVIIGGDFNTGFSPGSISPNKYAWYVEPFIDAGFVPTNFAEGEYLVTCIDGTEETGQQWILDNLYVSPNIDHGNVYVDTTKETDSIVEKIDHMPLIATVVIGGSS